MADGQPDRSLRGRDLAGLGGMLTGAVVVGLVLGLLADHAADSSPLWTMVGIFAGILGGGVGFWLRVRSVLK
jgi:F0F1-type ATP synthase assembly protein I